MINHFYSLLNHKKISAVRTLNNQSKHKKTGDK